MGKQFVTSADTDEAGLNKVVSYFWEMTTFHNRWQRILILRSLKKVRKLRD